MMFADERAVHKQAGMAVDAVETQDRMLAGVIGRDGERLPVGERLVVLDGIALHSRLAGNLYLVPLAIRGIPNCQVPLSRTAGVSTPANSCKTG